MESRDKLQFIYKGMIADKCRQMIEKHHLTPPNIINDWFKERLLKGDKITG